MSLTTFYEELFPALFDRLPDAFPEFGFKQIGEGYVSTTHYRFTHRNGASTGQVQAFRNNPRYLFDYSETPERVSLYDYLQQRDKHSSNRETLQTLARLAGVKMPSSRPEDDARFQAFERKAGMLEAIFDFSRDCLSAAGNTYATGAEAGIYRDYLTKERGYTEILLPGEQRNAERPKIEVGFLPSRVAARLYLSGLKDESGERLYSEAEVEDAVKLGWIGEEDYRLLIPFRRPSGSIAGFVSRNINFKPEQADNRTKYQYSPGLERKHLLFNLTRLQGDKRLVLVEGIFDALNASAKGLPNVAALGGVSFSDEQAELIKRAGAKTVILLLDADNAGQKATREIVETLLRKGLKSFVAMFPPGVKDLDELLQKKGIEAAKEVLRTPEPDFIYLLNSVLQAHSKEEPLSSIELEEFINDITRTSAKLDRISKDLYLKAFLDIDAVREIGISRETLEAVAAQIKADNERETQRRSLSELLRSAGEKVKQGETKEALTLIEERLKDVRLERGKDLIEPYTFADWESDISTAPEGKKTGIKSLDSFISIPPAAITLVAGRPSHGKTTFMFNLLLSMCEQYPEEKFYFFSYEEERKYILAKILNRLINANLEQYYPAPGWTNYNFIKYYLKQGKRDITVIEQGRERLRHLLEAGRIEIVGKSYSVEDLRAIIEAKAREEKIGGVFIDYIQRMKTERKTQDKRTEIAHISDVVLNIAKDTDTPIILGAQLNRDGSKSPTLENLKEAGNLEEDANLVLSVYNESREKPEDENGKSYEGKKVVNLEIKALKNRDGEPNRRTLLNFDRSTGAVTDLVKHF